MSGALCLIVDDEPVIRRFLRSVLLQRQLEIVEAENAVAAFRIIQKLNGRVDLLLTDIKMPGDMDGVDLAHSVRNSYPAIPIVLISGFCDERADQLDGFCCIPKPFLPETILKAVEAALVSVSRK